IAAAASSPTALAGSLRITTLSCYCRGLPSADSTSSRLSICMSSTGSADTPWRRVSSRLGAPALAVLAALLGGCGGDAPPADLILYNGVVHTLVGPPASVVAAADGRIVCVGDDECLAQAGDAARRIDLAGR